MLCDGNKVSWPKVSVHLHPAIVLLGRAAFRSYYEDVRTPQVLEALGELEKLSICTAPFTAYRRALDIEDHQARWTATLMAFAGIAGVVDVKRLETAMQMAMPRDITKGLHFLEREVELGQLFADIALQTATHPQKARECAQHAKNAYQKVFSSSLAAQFDEKTASVIGGRMSRLAAALRVSGEAV